MRSIRSPHPINLQGTRTPPLDPLGESGYVRYSVVETKSFEICIALGDLMAGESRLDRRAFLGAVAISAASGSSLFAQNKTERKVDPIALPLDKVDVWTLNFRYKAPRIITLDGLDKNGKPAKKNVWYMWYQVYNMYSEPQTFLPEFELVTKDLNTSHLDEPQPYIVDQLRKIEDPTGILNIQTTISISKRPVPPSLPDAIPRMVSGVAVWTEMNEKAPKTNRFSIYITGLSNGLAIEKTASDQKLIKRKTLQINFLRPTDDNRPQLGDIVPDDSNGPAEKWIYRSVSSVK
jgi:hypothetical protein